MVKDLKIYDGGEIVKDDGSIKRGSAHAQLLLPQLEVNDNSLGTQLAYYGVNILLHSLSAGFRNTAPQLLRSSRPANSSHRVPSFATRAMLDSPATMKA